MILSRFSVRALAAAVAVVVLATAPSVRAQKQDSNVAVVDIQAILASAAAAKDIRAQAEVMRKALETDARRWRDEIRKEEDDLIAQKPILSAERFNQRRQEIAQKAKGREAAYNNRIRQISAGLNEAMGKVRAVFRDVTADIAKERKIQMVFNRNALILVPAQMNITKDVLSRMDKKLPKVAVVLPK